LPRKFPIPILRICREVRAVRAPHHTQHTDHNSQDNHNSPDGGLDADSISSLIADSYAVKRHQGMWRALFREQSQYLDVVLALIARLNARKWPPFPARHHEQPAAPFCFASTTPRRMPSKPREPQPRRPGLPSQSVTEGPAATAAPAVISWKARP